MEFTKKDNKEPTKRPDATLRALEKNRFRHFVIKTKLNTFLKNKEYHQAINQAVIKGNQIAYGAYHLINLYLLDVLENDKPMPTLTDKFFRDACYASKLNGKWTSPKTDNDWFEAAQKYQHQVDQSNWIPPERKLAGNLVNNLVKEIKTATMI